MSLGGEVGSCSVAEVMGTEMFTVTPETAVASAQRLVLENDVHHMLVLDKGTLAGIVCREDLRFADRDARIEDCMTSPVLCITPDTTLQEAVDIMGANDIDCLPVVTGTFLVGIVTLEGLATANLSPSDADEDADGDDDKAATDEAPDIEYEDVSVRTEEDLALLRIEDDSDSYGYGFGKDAGATDGREAHGRCGACGGTTRDVMGGGDALPMCGRCRRLLSANQRC